MKRSRYFETFVTGPRNSSGAYALICPGVGLFVFANFLINPGLVALGVMEQFSLAWFIAYAPLVALQLMTIKVFFQLNAKLLKSVEPETGALAPAE